MKNNTMIDVNQGVHLVESEREASAILESQAELDRNEDMLLIINHGEAVSFRVRMQFVVATRLQGQHPSFRMHTSSNTPSVLMNVAHGSSRKF
jgi:hypothetical protein